MREFETGFIIQPEISAEGTEVILQKIDGVLEKHGATRLFCEDVGKRKLAYEIKKFQKGSYYYLYYLDDGQSVAEVERFLRLEESVLRFLTIQMNADVVDIEARVEWARQREEEQNKRASERAAREVEDAKARAQAEAAEVERAAAAEAAKAAEASEADGAGASEEAAAAAPGEAPTEAPEAPAADAAPEAAEAPSEAAPAETSEQPADTDEEKAS